jgi:hypothetical protein
MRNWNGKGMRWDGKPTGNRWEKECRTECKTECRMEYKSVILGHCCSPFRMYLVPLQLAAALLVVGNEIGEQHRKRTGNGQEQHRRCQIRWAAKKLTKFNKIGKISAIWSTVLVSFNQASRLAQSEHWAQVLLIQESRRWELNSPLVLITMLQESVLLQHALL